MWLAGKKEEQEKQLEVQKNSGIEVIAHRKATKDVVEQTKEVNKRLKDLLVENHITLKIYLASGGKKGENT